MPGNPYHSGGRRLTYRQWDEGTSVAIDVGDGGEHETTIERIINGSAAILRNQTGADQSIGTVVVIDTDHEESFVLSTDPAQTDRTVGVLIEDIPNGELGLVQTHGYCEFVRVTGSVGIGDKLYTSAIGGSASGDPIRSVGAFAEALAGPVETLGSTPGNSVFASAGVVGGGSPIQVPYPSPVVAGQLLLLSVLIIASGRTAITPSGWTLISGPNDGNGDRQYLFGKIADGTESGTLAVGIAGSVGGTRAAVMWAVDSPGASPWVEGLAFTTNSGTTVTAPDVTALGPGRLFVAITWLDNNVAIGDFTGELAGDWIEAHDWSLSGLRAQVQVSSGGSATTGGSLTIGASSVSTVLGFALVPTLTSDDDDRRPAILWGAPDEADDSGSLTVGDGTVEVDPATRIQVPAGGIDDGGGGEARLRFLLSRGGGQDFLATTTGSGSATELDLATANVFDVLLDDDCTLSFANPPLSGVRGRWTIILRQDGTGSRVVTWPAEVVWRDTDGTATATPPDLATAADAVDVVTLTTLDGGASYGAALDSSGGSSDPALGGDLSGTASAATVEAVQGVAVTDAGTTGDVLTKTGAATATWSTPASSGGGVGPILISDSPSTPLVFADLIQNEAQDDLVYADT